MHTTGFPSLSVVIMCEVWPAWLFVIGSLRVDCSHVYVFSPAPTWLPLIQRAFPLLTISVAVSHPPLIVDNTWILCSGSSSWLSTLLPFYASTCCCLASVTYNPLSSDAISTYAASVIQFDSSLAGSVMRQEWHFVLPASCPALTPPNMYPRQLAHIVDSTIRPPIPSLAGTQPLSVNDHLSWSSLFSLFQCRCVFSRSGVVTRPLTSVELSRAYDLPTWLWCFHLNFGGPPGMGHAVVLRICLECGNQSYTPRTGFCGPTLQLWGMWLLRNWKSPVINEIICPTFSFVPA